MGRLGVMGWRVWLIALLALAWPASVALATSYTFTITEPFSIPDPCPANSGEMLVGTRTWHQEFNVVVNGNLFHLHSTEKDQYSLVGALSLAQYQGGAEFINDFNVAAGVQDSVIQTIQIMRQGQTIQNDDFFLHQTLHVTVNANGVPTATVNNFRAECT